MQDIQKKFSCILSGQNSASSVFHRAVIHSTVFSHRDNQPAKDIDR